LSLLKKERGKASVWEIEGERKERKGAPIGLKENQPFCEEDGRRNAFLGKQERRRGERIESK